MPIIRQALGVIKKAEDSYKIAYASLFSKDIAPFNPERFEHEVQSPLTLEDVKDFVLEFVRRGGRKVSESGDGMFEFLLPDSLKGVEGLERRYVKVTFDRTTAIRNSEAEFMAIGHPFTSAVLKRCGSVDFGGLASRKVIRRSPLVSANGVLFNFTVKVTKAAPDGESVFFEFTPVFVRDDGTVDPKAAKTQNCRPTSPNHSPVLRNESAGRLKQRLADRRQGHQWSGALPSPLLAPEEAKQARKSQVPTN